MSNEQIIWNYCKAQGLNNYGTAGLMGNLFAESGLLPNNLQNTYEKSLGYTDTAYTQAVDNGSYKNFVKDSAGYGLAQWTYHTRKQALYDYIKDNNYSIGDLQGQLEFLFAELSSTFPTILPRLKQASSLLEASNIVLLEYEKPAVTTDSVKSKRASYGQVYYDKYAEVTQDKNEGGTQVKTPIERVLAQAWAEVGYLEKATNSNLYSPTENAGFANFNKYANDLDKTDLYNGKKNGYDWCDIFVDWLFYVTFGLDKTKEITGQPKDSAGAGCGQSKKYYEAIGCWHKSNPKVGDQIFFYNGTSYYHTGIVVDVDSTTIYTIEGNTSSASGVEPNGGAVRNKSYKLSYNLIGGYGRPKYDLIPNEEEVEEEEEMSYETFVSYQKRYEEERAKLEADSWATPIIAEAIDMGITVKGSRPQSYVTRQEAMTMSKAAALYVPKS